MLELKWLSFLFVTNFALCLHVSSFAQSPWAGTLSAQRISVDPNGVEWPYHSGLPNDTPGGFPTIRVAKLNANGTLAVFQSRAPLAPGAVANVDSIFVRSLQSGNIMRIVDDECVHESAMRWYPDISICSDIVTYVTPRDPNDLVVTHWMSGSSADCTSAGYGLVAWHDLKLGAAMTATSALGDKTVAVFYGYGAPSPLRAATENYCVIFEGGTPFEMPDPGVLPDPNGAWAPGRSDQPDISGDGRYIIVCRLTGTNQPQVYVWGDLLGNYRTVSINAAGDEAEDSSGFDISGDDLSISFSGRYAAFAIAATNLDPNAPPWVEHIYVHDRDADSDDIFDEPEAVSTRYVSKSSCGKPGNALALQPSLSGDGRFVAFASRATNLAPGVESGDYRWRIYVHDRDVDNNGVFDEPGEIGTFLVSQPLGEWNGDSYNPIISADGRTIVFTSTSDNLVPDDNNGVADVFVVDVHSECPGDTDADGDTDVLDLTAIIGAYGLCVGDPGYEPRFDFDADGCVGPTDLSTVLNGYGCPEEK